MPEPTHIRSNHPFAFRSGEWAKLIDTDEYKGRKCYVVQFKDKRMDYWVIDDPDGQYEFRTLVHGHRA